MYKKDWPWRVETDALLSRQWKMARGWGRKIKFKRTAACEVFLTEEQDEILTDCEASCVNAEEAALAHCKERYPRLADKWDVAWFKKRVAAMRDLAMRADGLEWGMVAGVSAYRRALDAQRQRHAQALPFYIPNGRVTTVRLACGLHYERPLRRLAEAGAWEVVGLGKILLAAELGDLGGCAFGDCARIERSWWMRFVFVDSNKFGEKMEKEEGAPS